jgi:hypothetical protein
LHAGVVVPPGNRERLEHLCRYVARPPVATGRLSRLPDGRLLYRLKRRWRDGTTHMIFEPAELLEKLVSLVPPPRSHQVRYHGVLAPCASWRACVVPLPPEGPPAVPSGPRQPPAPGRCPVESAARRQHRVLGDGSRQPPRRVAGRVNSCTPHRPSRQPTTLSLGGADAPRLRCGCSGMPSPLRRATSHPRCDP